MLTLNPHEKKYPQAFGFLKSNLPTLPTSAPNVWDAFLAHSKLSKSDARSAITPGGLPPLIFAQDLGLAVWGSFNSEVPDRVEISREVLQQFEKTPSAPTAQEFLMGKALHEMCHWGCFRGGFDDPDVSGEAFEKEAFGAEKQPWWITPKAAIEKIFTDPAARAHLLLEQLNRPGNVPGRVDDPEQKVFGGADAGAGMARGYRNNNPGNIRVSSANWNGLAEADEQKSFQRTETSFCVFREPEWGLRAMFRLLRTYKSHGADTPRKIISRWAPTSDGNNVESYSTHLAKALGVSVDTQVDAADHAQVTTMVRAMATHENGSKPPYSDVQFKSALLLA